MKVQRLIIKNFKCYEYFDVKLNDDLNILIGNNEAGKSTILEALMLGLTGMYNYKSIQQEISPYLFNQKAVDQFIDDVKNNKKIDPPSIVIELYVENTPETAGFKGRQNSLNSNETGVKIVIAFDQNYRLEYTKYISKPADVTTIPAEYYGAQWHSFAGNGITTQGFPFKTMFIDTSSTRLQTANDYYLQSVIRNVLHPTERAGLDLSFRQLKEEFGKEPYIKDINDKIQGSAGYLHSKQVQLSVDISQKNGWESHLTTYAEGIPFAHIGKGKQNFVKIMLALHPTGKQCSVILIEEPENHQSFTNLQKLLHEITQSCSGKQIILTTHSTYILNKLGLNYAILLNRTSAGANQTTFSSLSPGTLKYFKKLPGYDTLRFLLTERAILVEGPSDELLVQKAYWHKHGRLPIEDGIDVISVRGLAFLRFLELATPLQKEVTVITDNDSDHTKVQQKYKDYNGKPGFKLCCSTDNTLPSLEDNFVKVNKKSQIESVIGQTFATEQDLLAHMKKNANKTEWAFSIFDSTDQFTYPQYIEDAI